MATITSNQHSYSNASALLNVSATAARTGASTVSITASWSIYTAGSSYAGATRYLVLFIGSASGTKYYSTAIGTNWSTQTTYTGSYTFSDIPLAADATEITIGFGVSGSNTSLSSNGTLIWNGSASVSSSTYDPDIQFGTVTGIAQGYTKCSAPTSFVVSPSITEGDVTLTWFGANSGLNNGISDYEIQYSTSDDGASWGGWFAFKTPTSSPTTDRLGISRGQYEKYRIRTRGYAGSSYYSEWKESNTVRKNSLPGIPTNPQLSAALISSGDTLTISWSASTDVDGNLAGYRLSKSVNGADYETISGNGTVSRQVTLTGEPGDRIQLVVRAEDKLGAASAWLDIGTVAINAAPTAPTAASIDKAEYSPGECVELSWSGADDPDGNIKGFLIDYCILDFSGAEPEWLVLTEVETESGSGTYAFIPTQAMYQEIMQFRIRTVDTFDAVSDTLIIGSILRNDTPHAAVGKNGSFVHHVPLIHSSGELAGYMPYIYQNGNWHRHSGTR